MGVLAVVVLVGVGWGLRWWTHPSLFRDGDAGGLVLNPVATNRFPVYIGFGYGPGPGSGAETITIDSARVHLTRNTSAASASLAVCTRRPVRVGTLVLGTSFASYATPSKYCSRLRPVRHGTKMRVDDGREYLVATLTPHQPGKARFGAVDIDYTRGWSHLRQHGTQRITQSVLIYVGPAQLSP